MDRCFAKAILDFEYIDSGQNSDNDSDYLAYKCSTTELSARFRFVQNRTDSHVWCSYKFGKSLGEIPEFKLGDIVSVPPLPLRSVRWMVWLFG